MLEEGDTRGLGLKRPRAMAVIPSQGTSDTAWRGSCAKRDARETDAYAPLIKAARAAAGA